jgi:ABC-type cobalt transport system substrate-binding protein
MRRRALAALLLVASQLAPAARAAQAAAPALAVSATAAQPTAAAEPDEPARWAGVDEAVIEKMAAEAGRTARPLWFELEGDLALFLFLCAGIAGGSVLGYCFRMIFVERIDEKPGHESRAH